MSLSSDKADLRRRLRARRRTLALKAPDAAERAAQRLPLSRLPAFAVFSGYHAMGSELDPSPLIRRLARTGALFALPAAEYVEGPLAFRLWDPRDALQRDALGVPCPPPGAPEITPDLVITPLLAFDRKGGRLGQGGGHFDRAVAALRARAKIFVLGLAYAGQEVEATPMEPHDERLDAILTETDYIEVG